MPRPQLTLRALLVAMLVVGAFFGGIRFERERQRRQDERRYELDLTGGQSGFFSFEGPLRPDELRALLANPETIDRLQALSESSD
jgi:hypothetical protein